MADVKDRVVRRVKASSASSSEKAKKVSRKISASSDDKAAKTPVKFTKDANGREVSEKMAAKLAKKQAKGSNGKHFWAVAWIFWIGRYFRESWRELRAVEWTNRRATWALTLAVLAFTAFFAVFVLVFDWIFQLFIKNIIL
jgi:preprotein translocase SecE subunit